MTDPQAAERLMKEMHAIAVGADKYEYGLPIYDRQIIPLMMRAIEHFEAAAERRVWEEIAKYAREHCVTPCKGTDAWQRGHNAAALHIADYCLEQATPTREGKSDE